MVFSITCSLPKESSDITAVPYARPRGPGDSPGREKNVCFLILWHMVHVFGYMKIIFPIARSFPRLTEDALDDTCILELRL